MLLRRTPYGTEVQLTCKATWSDKKPVSRRLCVRPDGQIEYWDEKFQCFAPATVSAKTRQYAYNWADYGK